jgi:hypothetical protein
MPTLTVAADCLWQAKAMFDKAAEMSEDLPFKLEFHTGFWASSRYLHAHLIFGTLEYYVARSRYFAERSGPSEPDEVWEAYVQGRAGFVDCDTAKNAGCAAALARLFADARFRPGLCGTKDSELRRFERYKVKDGRSIAREIQQPSRRYTSKDLKCAEWYVHKNGFSFSLDASSEGCSVISCRFDSELSSMDTAVLTDALRHSIGMVLSEFGIKDMQIHITPKLEIRFFVPVEPFISLLRADERRVWFQRWSSLPDPVLTAEKSDQALLPDTQAEAEAKVRGTIRIGVHAKTSLHGVEECRPDKKQKGISPASLTA